MGIKNILSSKNREKSNTVLSNLAKELEGFIGNSNACKNLSKEEVLDIKKRALSEDTQEVLRKGNVKGFQPSKSMHEMVFHFFGMNDNWKWGRNILGAFLVHGPEYPTYFIPSFSQANATGEAGHVKKGEIPRGLITGAMEGLAVGALVSGENLKIKEMGPYVILGAGLQLFSCIVFPWLGEKTGKYLYNRRMAKKGLAKPALPQIETEVITPPKVGKKDDKKPTFKGKQLYTRMYSGGMRV